MARRKYWGITVAKDIEDGVIVSIRLDQMFVITQKLSGKKTDLRVFHPSDILDEKEKTLEKKFKRYVANYTDQRIMITPEVKNYLSKMEKRLRKN